MLAGLTDVARQPPINAVRRVPTSARSTVEVPKDEVIRILWENPF